MKKLTISSDTLRTALKRLSLAIKSHKILPVLSNLYFVVGKDSVEITASDLELTIVVRCAAEVDKSEGLEFVIPFDFLNNIVKVVGSLPLLITYHNQKKIEIAGDNDVFEVTGLDKASDYPQTAPLPKKNSLQLGEGFVELLEKAMLSVSGDEKKPSMQQACLDMKQKDVFLVSTDSYVLYRHKINVQPTEKMELLFSPRLASAVYGLKDVELSWTDKNIGLRSGDISVISRRLDVKFPNYNVIIGEFESTLQVKRSDLIHALKKTLIIADGSKRTALLLNQEQGTIVFDAIDVDMGRKADVKISATNTGKVDSITINSMKLLTVLDQIEVDDVRLSITDPKKAILIKADENPDYLGLLMPIVS